MKKILAPLAVIAGLSVMSIAPANAMTFAQLLHRAPPAPVTKTVSIPNPNPTQGGVVGSFGGQPVYMATPTTTKTTVTSAQMCSNVNGNWICR